MKISKKSKNKIWSMLDDAVTNRSSQLLEFQFLFVEIKKILMEELWFLENLIKTNNLVQFHSDIRSDKIPKLKSNKNGSMLFYDTRKKKSK